MLFSVVCTWYGDGHSWKRQRCSSRGAVPESRVYGLVGEVRLPPNSLKGSVLLIKSPIPSVTLLQPPGPSGPQMILNLLLRKPDPSPFFNPLSSPSHWLFSCTAETQDLISFFLEGCPKTNHCVWGLSASYFLVAKMEISQTIRHRLHLRESGLS